MIGEEASNARTHKTRNEKGKIQRTKGRNTKSTRRCRRTKGMTRKDGEA